MVEALERQSQQKSSNIVNIVLGYNGFRKEGRLLDDSDTNDTAQDTNDTAQESKVNATATGGLLVAALITGIVVFAMVMMANIQTPQAFARRDLVKGKINK